MKSSHLSSRLTGALVGLALWAAAPGAEAAPRALVPRPAAVKHTGRELPPDTNVERLVVKFHEGSRVRLRGNRLATLPSERNPAERELLSARGLSESRLKADVEAASALLERAPRAGALARLFLEDEAILEARKASAEEQGGRRLTDLNLYFEVPLLPGTTSERVADLVAALNVLEGVEVAYAQPPAEPAMVNHGMDAALRGLLAAADIAPTTPLFEGSQGYLNAAPAGIDARFAWGVPGGNGAGVRVVDIEGGWRTTHEDMPTLFYQGGTQINDLSWRNHGTAVLGELVGAPNAYGVTGIAHAATAGIEGIGGQSTASAISRAAAAVGRGGVILIELHAGGPSDGTACTCNTGQCNYIAMEYWQAEFDAIATATANGVVVVEAAGNGSANLDAPAYGNAFNRNVRDSGAIVVGASTATTRVPMCWTNFGSRVDVHGWGEQVTTLGYGDLFTSGEDQYYTATFSGTSSASPIVTGAAASIQGASLASGRGALDSRTMRGLLAGSGTAQAADSRRIGPLPDLRRALTQLRSSCPLLAPGQSLTVGQSVNGCGAAFIVFQGDGNVVLYQSNRPRWATGTSGQNPALFVMQTDGNLVLYAPNGTPLWASGTGGYPGAKLDLEQECNLVIRGTDGRVLWSSGSRCVTNACGSLLAGDVLYPGQGVSSCNGRATLSLQSDGNVVLYRNDGVPLWASGTQQVPGKLPMQSDGNLVLYGASGTPVWASGTSGHNGANLFIQDDCNAVIYNASGQPVWHSGTQCQ